MSELLDRVLKVARDDLTPFDAQRADLSQAEARRLVAIVSGIRARMLEALAALGIPAPKSEGSARWAARTAFLFSEIALSELSGAGLRGYGTLDPTDERKIAAAARDLRRMVERAQELLRGVDPGAVDEAVERVRGPAGEALREIWRFARRHELVEVYPEVAAVAERAAAPAVDVGVFGRTNAGKSSLINALVRLDVLPVGSVPVTAIPLRLARGPAALRVRRKGRLDEELPLEEIGRFTLEVLEGAVESDVVALDAFVPDAPSGLRFIDTPGVGAYATPVGARAFEWLPRCDLGLLLLPAGSTVEPEDAALARGLVAAGIEVRVLLSKADLVVPAELERSTRYVRAELARQLGSDVADPLTVTVTHEEGEGLNALRRTVLDPLAAAGERSAVGRVQGRMLHLVGTVEAAFEGSSTESLEAGTEHRIALEEARARVDVVLGELRRSAAGAVSAAADVLARAWAEGRHEVTGEVERVLDAPPREALETVRRHFDEAAGNVGGSSAAPASAMPPLFSLDARELLPSLAPGALAGRLLARTRAARRLAPVESAADEAYRRYADRLHAWSEAMLTALSDRRTRFSDAEPATAVEELRAAVSALGEG